MAQYPRMPGAPKRTTAAAHAATIGPQPRLTPVKPKKATRKKKR